MFRFGGHSSTGKDVRFFASPSPRGGSNRPEAVGFWRTVDNRRGCGEVEARRRLPITEDVARWDQRGWGQHWHWEGNGQSHKNRHTYSVFVRVGDA